MISFIISTYERPTYLRGCLASLAIQPVPFEIIVTLNSLNDSVNREIAVAVREECRSFLHRVKMKLTGLSGATCCYSAAELVVSETRGEWLCFPSEDSYYLPRFSELMLKAAAEKDLDLVYSSGVLYSRPNAAYPPFVHEQMPVVNNIDKTSFIVKREWFQEFPGKDPTKPVSADGLFIEALVRRGIKHGKAPGITVVHN